MSEFDNLTAEDLDCLGLRRVVRGFEDRDWRNWPEAAAADDRLLNAFAARSAPRQRRVRRPSLESTVRQVLKAAQAAGVSIAVTIEGDTVTASPTRGIAPATREDRTPGEQPPDAPPRSLFKARAIPKQKVVL
jgi:hypothetical protein